MFTNCLADPALGQQSRAIDFYNNDLHNVTDNFIETDGGYANIRVLRNRCFNGMAAPLSVQPVYAGPVYWIRNVLYNAHKGAGVQAGSRINDNVICYHNTLTNHWTNAGGLDFGDVRNNLFMGPADYFSERERQRGRTVLNIGFQDSASSRPQRPPRGLPVEKPFVSTEKALHRLRVGRSHRPRAHGSEIRDYDEVFMATEEPEHAPNNEGRLYRPNRSRSATESPTHRSSTPAAACRGSTTISPARHRTWARTSTDNLSRTMARVIRTTFQRR